MSVRTRSLLAWIAVGLVGLALAAGVTYAATQLSSQRIGLSAEPPSAGEDLAPSRPAPSRPVNAHNNARGMTRPSRSEERTEHRPTSGASTSSGGSTSSGDQDD